MKYTDISTQKAYRLINHGPLVCVATKGVHYDLTPIAWNCPVDYEPVTKVLFVCDPSHQCAVNIKKTREFALCVPHISQADMVNACGSVSSPEADKFTQFGIASVPAAKINARVPEGVTGWIECRLVRIVPEGSVELFIGEAVAARVRCEAWDGESLKAGAPEAKTVHHLGGGFVSICAPGQAQA